MTIASQADYRSALRRYIRYRKNGGDNTQYGAGLNFLDMSVSGGDPSAVTPVTANTTSGIVPTRATSGYPDIGDLSGGVTAYLSRVQFTKDGDGTGARLILFDRLWQAGTFAIGSSPYTLSSQPSFSSRVPGGTDYVGTQLWAMGGGNNAGTTVSVQYTDQNGNTGHNTPARAIPYFLAGSPPGHFDCFQLPLQAGDSGIQKVEGVTLVNGAGTAVCHLMIIRPLWTGTAAVETVSVDHGPLRTGMPQVFADSALAVMVQYAMVNVSPSFEMNIELAIK